MPGQKRSFWESLRHLVLLLLPTLPSACLLAGVFALLVGSDQGVEILESSRDPAKLACIHSASLLLGLMGWYTNRVLLGVDYQRPLLRADGRGEWASRVPRDFAMPTDLRGTGGLGHCARTWWPRFLGLLPMLGTAAGFAYGGVFAQTFVALVLAAIYLVFVIFRRALCRRVGIPISERPVWRSTMPRETVFVVFAVLTLNALLFALFLLSPVLAPQWVGSADVLFATAGWVTIVNVLLVYPGFRFCYARWLPSYTPFAMLLLWLAMVGAHSDNHHFRKAEASVLRERPSVADHFRHFRGVRDGERGPLPVVIVSSEGGGIRAAYWTASVLGHLADQVPGFACHVFAISGASGGSVGALTYASLIAERVERAEVDCVSNPSLTTKGVRADAEEILARDFLAPVLGGLLTSDLAQRFVPTFLFTFRDRAENFERALEWAWAHPSPETQRPPRWHKDFLDLWQADAARDSVPSLFLNLTWVESGANGVVSNLLWPPLPARDRAETPSPEDETDLLAVLGHPLPMSAAAHAGARFPLVSPPASIETREGIRRVVDGGYFENSGTLTALEIERDLRTQCGDRCQFFRLILSNDPGHPEVTQGVRAKRAPVRFAELASAFGALWNGRTAHGRLAEARFLRAHPGELGDERIHSVRVRPVANERDPALGWFLAKRSRENLRAQATRAEVSDAPRRWFESLEASRAAPRPPE